MWVMGMLRITGLAVTLGALASGCAGSTQQTVVRVAQHDLACDRVEVDEIAKNRYGAFGCGRGAVYTQLCDPGQSCRWGRLRHGHERALGGQGAAAADGRQVTQGGEQPPRLILPAPAPNAREVLPAPAPQGRAVLPAPGLPAPGLPAPGKNGASDANNAEGQAPAGNAGTEGAAGSEGAEKPESDASGTGAQADGASAANAPAAPAPDPEAPLSLSQGLLSDPYQTTVPAEQTSQRSELPPPVPLQEARPPAPSPTYVWVGGYWWWGSHNWMWLPGYWSAPRMGFSYVPGGWYWANNYWWYGPGGWAYPGSRVIVHRVPPRPTTYATVRSFTPNRAVFDGRGPRASAGLAHGVAGPKRMPGDTGFRPSDSPLRSYPTGTPRRSADASSGMSTPRQSAGVGRVITPGQRVPNQNYGLQRGFSTPRGYSGSPHVSPPRMGSPHTSSPRMSAPPRMSTPHMSSPRMSAPRMSAPRMSAPRMSSPRMSSPRGGR